MGGARKGGIGMKGRRGFGIDGVVMSKTYIIEEYHCIVHVAVFSHSPFPDP